MDVVILKWGGAALAFASATAAFWLFVRSRNLGNVEGVIRKIEGQLVEARENLRDVQNDYASVTSLLFRALNEGDKDAVVRRQIAYDLRTKNLGLAQIDSANDDLALNKDYSQVVLVKACDEATEKLRAKIADDSAAIAATEALLAEQKLLVQDRFARDFRWALLVQILGMLAIVMQAFSGD